jgi:phosphoglycolate phosphatase-like HAD superfamily hydrolase
LLEGKLVNLRVKAMLIDLDGTIVDIGEPLIEAAGQTASALGLRNIDPKIGLELAKELQTNSSPNKAFAKFGVEEKMRKGFLETFLSTWHSIVSIRTALLPRADVTLHRLSESYLLALITRREMPKEPIRNELERLGLTRYFKLIVTSQDVKEPKPSPQAFLIAAHRLGVSPEECLVVGDSITDIQAGRLAGARTAAVLSGLFSREELEKEKPDLIIRDINSLLDFLPKKANHS